MSNSPDIDTSTRDELIAILDEGDCSALTQHVAEYHPADVADALDLIEEPERKLLLFDVLEPVQASEVIREVDDPTWEVLQQHLSDGRLSDLLAHLDTDDAADLLGQLPASRQRALLERASPETRRDLGELLTYPEDTAGGIMKTEVATVSVGATVRQITEYLRRKGEQFHDVHNVFVIDTRGRLLGYIALRRLLLANEDTIASEIMETDMVSVRAEIDQEEVAHLFEKYDLLSIPVVDSLDRLVGRITVDDIVDVMQEEATEDMLRLAGVSGEEIKIVNPLQAVRNRLPWLALNLLTASVAAATIATFENTIQAVAVAAALMTVVASQGGNAGSQTMTLIVRGLALGQIEPRQVLRILGRESIVELANGSVLGGIAGAVVYLWRGDAALALVLAGAMIINLQVAAAVGSLVPLALKLIGVDPAVASTVFVTAATDIFGFFIFLGLLSAFL